MDHERIRRQNRNCGGRFWLPCPGYIPTLSELRGDIMASPDRATRDEGRGSVPRQKMSPGFASLSTLISAWKRDSRKKYKGLHWRERVDVAKLATAIANENNQ